VRAPPIRPRSARHSPGAITSEWRGNPIRFDERNQATPKLYVAVIKGGQRVIVEDVDTTGVPY
jgi:hypothetical protein